MSNTKEMFDELIGALINEGAEGGTFSLFEKEQKGVTYLLCDSSDRAFGDLNMMLYAVPSKDEFITKLRDLLGEETLDVWDNDVQEAAWEVLGRYEVVHFDEAG
jgi:hypothetical protein